MRATVLTPIRAALERDARPPRAHEWVEMLHGLLPRPVSTDGARFEAAIFTVGDGRVCVRFADAPVHPEPARMSRPPLGRIV